MAEKAKAEAVGGKERAKAEAEPPKTGGEPVKPGAPTKDEENDCDRENHRYHIAFLLISGLIILLLIPVLYKNYDSAGDLAAIFSGWITSVVGFYFLQQNTEKAQQQTTIAAKDAAEARKEVASVSKTQVNLASHASTTSFKWRKMFEDANQERVIYEGLYKEAQGLYKEAQTLINDMLQELDGDAGSDD